MAETQLLDIIKNSRQKFWETQQRFNKRSEILEITANNTTLSLNDFGKARELIAKGVEITKDYFVACEAIIFSLDAAARPVIESLSVETVGQIADLLKEITQDMEGTTTSFNVYLNGRNMGSSDLMPKPGILATSTQLFWTQLFETMPGYASEMARRKEAKRQQEKQLQRDKEQAAATVQEAKSRLEKKHNSDADARNKLKERCDAALEQFREDATRYLEQAPAAFREKKVEELANQYAATLDTHLNQAFTQKTVEETVKTKENNVKAADVLLEDLEKDIYGTLFYSDHWMSITDIAVEGNLDASNQKIGAAMRKLVETGLVIKMESRYAMPGTPYPVKVIIWKENAAVAKKPIPAPPALDFEIPKDEPAPLPQKKRSKLPLIIAAIAACVALVVGILVFNGMTKSQREADAKAMAQSAVDELYQKELQASEFLKGYGVTQLSATVEDVVYIRSKDLLIKNKPHYLVILRIDCQADNVPKSEMYKLVNCLGRALPDEFGQVDGYPVKGRAEIMSSSAKLLGKEASYYDLAVMVNIYVNGELEGTPGSYR